MIELKELNRVLSLISWWRFLFLAWHQNKVRDIEIDSTEALFISGLGPSRFEVSVMEGGRRAGAICLKALATTIVGGLK